jgi:RNA polymerase sigma factor (sigma-70 family)
VPADIGELVRLAGAGNERAWAVLVDRFSPMLWAISRSYRLPAPDAADVVQVAWLRLLQHLPRLRQPQFVAAWLATTARRECLSAIHRHDRERPHDLGDETFPAHEPGRGEVDEGLLRAERNHIVHRTVKQLPPRQQLLVRLLSADPPATYREISAATGIPIGSIGPTRARALHRLRTLLEREGAIAG